jgi:hypothetical protein
MSKWLKKMANNDEDNSSLQYKEHREFFQKFFDIRTAFTSTLAQCSLTPKDSLLKELYEYLSAIIDWTDPYIINNKNVDKMLEDIENKIYKASKIRENQKMNKDIVKDIRTLFRLISKDHEKNEIIPRLQVSEPEPWADEKDSKKKVMLKTVMTMFQNV